MVTRTTDTPAAHRAAHRAGHRTGPRRGRIAALAAAALLVGVVGPTAALAVPISGAIVDVSVTPGPILNGQQVTTTINWCVPDGTRSGDTFTLQLSEHLRAVPPAFTLTDGPGGPVVANVVVTGSVPDQVANFTMSSYAETAHNVCGSAYLRTDTSNQMTPGSVDFTYVDGDGNTFGNPVIVQPSTPQPGPVKVGRFETTDQGHTTTDDVLSWRLTGPAGPLDTVTFSDDPPAGQLIDCAATAEEILIGTRTQNATLAGAVPYTDGVLTCTPDAMTYVTGPVAAGQAIQVRVFIDLEAPTGPGPVTFLNTADFSMTAQGQTVATSVPASRAQNDAGGSGNGDGVTIQKWTTAGGFPAGDFDTAPGRTVTPLVPTAVTATVSNPGPNVLTTVQISDITGNGPTMTGLVCTFPDGSTGTSWPGPWAVGSSFPCTGSVPGLEPGTTHLNTMVVNAVGNGLVYATDPLHLTAAGAVSVGDFVFADANGNGTQDAGEPGITGAVLTLSGPDGQPVTDVLGQPVGPLTTGADGLYSFTNLPILPPGQHYTVVVTPPAGYLPTLPNVGDPATDSSTGSAESGDLTTHGARDATLDFGFVAAAPAITLEKTDAAGHDADTPAEAVDLGYQGTASLVFTSTNTGNEPLVGITVADRVVSNGTVTGLSCTFPDGSTGVGWSGPLAVGASFTCTATLSGVVPGEPHVDLATVTGTGQFSGIPVSDDDPFTATTPAPVRVGDVVWVDTNKNGVQDPGEPGIPGITLVLTDGSGKPVVDIHGNPVGPVTTDAAGRYLFPDLPPGRYTVTLDPAKLPAGYTPTVAGAGSRDTDSSTGSASSTDLTAGQEDLTLDFGFVPAVDVEGTTAPPLPSTTSSSTGIPVPTTTTTTTTTRVKPLASTGAGIPVGGAIGVAALVLLLGAGLVVAGSRRRASRH